MDTSPAQLQQYLDGVEYPARKNDIMRAAREQDAPQDVIQTIDMLPDMEYDSPSDISDAMEQMQ